MSKIALLSDFVIDQIAAGEVVEHPAAAVKELIENSIDAGASDILVEIEGGGLMRILIEDDGCGMNREDALLCLRRHATSKIRSADDLQQLVSMGFRGEALAALAAVSKLELRTSDGNVGTQVVGSEIKPCARNRGTSVDAGSLFFNAPARLKFQKSSSACAAAILKVVQTISLAHPGIRFRLRSNGKLTFGVDQADWKQRAEEVLGPFAHEVRQGSIRGLLGRPDEGKLNRSGQTLFVNRRPIFSPLIAKAVKDGFGSRIKESLFPVFLLFLDLPADSIDVNVHPQKKEIRFRDEGKVYGMVRDAVDRAFGSAPEIAPVPWEFEPVPFKFESQPSFVLDDAPVELPIETRFPRVMLGDYLLVEGEEWMLVDVKGAEARIAFEEMNKGDSVLQPLIWPLEISVDSPEEVAAGLKEARIEARPLSKRMIAIDALPAGLEPENVPLFVQEFMAGKGERRLAASITKACRASRHRCSFEQAVLVWRRLKTCKDQEYDPLGKKIAARITEKQIAEFFH